VSDLVQVFADSRAHIKSSRIASCINKLTLHPKVLKKIICEHQPYDLIIKDHIAKMAPSQLPPIFNATSQDIEMLLAAQCHLGSKNMQVHMESYLWKTRPDGINVINIGKTW
jgi:small subunit ribosomal protein SAe